MIPRTRSIDVLDVHVEARRENLQTFPRTPLNGWSRFVVSDDGSVVVVGRRCTRVMNASGLITGDPHIRIIHERKTWGREQTCKHTLHWARSVVNV